MGWLIAASLVLYGVWCIVAAIQIEGRLRNDALALMGVDPTNADQLLKAWQDPAYEMTVRQARIKYGYVWFLLREALMFILAAMTSIAVLRTTPSSGTWLRALAIASVVSKLILTPLIPGAGNMVGHLGVAVLATAWWVFIIRLYERRVLQSTSPLP